MCSHPLTAIFSQLAPVYKHPPLCKPIFNKACGLWFFQKQCSSTLGLYGLKHECMNTISSWEKDEAWLPDHITTTKKEHHVLVWRRDTSWSGGGVNLILDDHEQGSSRDQMTAVGWHLKNVVRRQLDNWVFQVNQPPVFWAFCVKGTGATFGGYQIFWWCVMGKLVSLDKELLSKTSYTYIYLQTPVALITWLVIW